MSENQDLRSGETTAFDHAQPIPAARPLRDFSWERVDQDLVLFDRDLMHYHTLNAVAERVWRSCDGIATIETISICTSLPVDVIETTIGELGEASLLRTPASAWSVPMSRRRAAKLLAAGAAGAVGLPVVLSITAPSHQAAASHVECGAENQSCPEGHAPVPSCTPGWTASCCNVAGAGWVWRAGAVC